MKKKPIVVAVVILAGALLLRMFVLQSYKSTTDYMEETLTVGDYFLVNKFIFGRKIPFIDARFLAIREPRRGDVVVFQYPEDPDRIFVMRVVGVPGDVIEGVDKKILVNGRPAPDTHVIHLEREIVPRERHPRDNFGPVTVPAHSVFVMGDNRDRSYDSRFWGCVDYGRIKGLAFYKYWSWDGEKRRVRWGNVGKRID